MPDRIYESKLQGKTRKSRLEFYKSGDTDYWRWRLVAGNGEIIAAATEPFNSFESARDNATLVKQTLNGIQFGEY